MTLSTRSSAVALLLASALLLTVLAAGASAAPTAEEVLALAKAGEVAGKDLSGAQAAGIVLEGQNLRGVGLREADLRGVILRGCDLAGANLSRANLRGAVLEQVSLLDADLSGCDLSGALIRLTNLDGANLIDCRFTGASLDAVLLTSSGGTHLPGLRVALQQATGQQFSRPWVAALSGDAFAFVYNTENPGFWPGTPFTVNPLTAAPAILGLQTKQREDYFSDQFLMDEKKSAEGVHLLPMRATQDPGVLQGRPLWAVVAGREKDEKRTYFALYVPPFGPQTYRSSELVELWTGPFENLEPAGSLRTVRKPLVTIITGGQVPAPAEQARAVLRQAAQIIVDRRTYGPLVPGEAGLTKLAAELRAAAQTGDLEAARRLAVWGGYPHQCLLGARREACDFLREAVPLLEGQPKAAAEAVLGLYQSNVQLLAHDWPGLQTTAETMDAAAKQRYLQAADLIGQCAANERRAAETIEAGLR